MAKIVYESIVIIFTSSVIFASTLSSVLLVLLWHDDQILGIDTNLAIGVCIVCVIVFSIGLVGTIAESFKSLMIYACLLVIFPFGVLLIQLSIRLSTKPWNLMDQMLVIALIILFIQIVVAYLLAREIRKYSLMNRGINYKVCEREDGILGGSEMQLVNHSHDYFTS